MMIKTVQLDKSPLEKCQIWTTFFSGRKRDGAPASATLCIQQTPFLPVESCIPTNEEFESKNQNVLSLSFCWDESLKNLCLHLPLGVGLRAAAAADDDDEPEAACKDGYAPVISHTLIWLCYPTLNSII